MIRKIFIAVFIMAIIATAAFAQMHGKMKAIQKMEELKKIKLIEILQLDEDILTKFFLVRAHHIAKIESYKKFGKEKIDQIDEMLKNQNEKSDPAIKETIEEYLRMQELIKEEQQKFYIIASKILTTVQMAKFVVFEERFRNEISGLLFRERKRKLR